MVELFCFTKKLRSVNSNWLFAYNLYLYRDPAYSIVYSIINLDTNYPWRSLTPAQEKFNKAIAKSQIEVE